MPACLKGRQVLRNISLGLYFTHSKGRRSVRIRKNTCSPAGCWQVNFAVAKYWKNLSFTLAVGRSSLYMMKDENPGGLSTAGCVGMVAGR
jgi:hypothetical protein